MTLLFICSPLRANPILTEIYYNGPTPGSDPDEFIELSNPTDGALDLTGWRFTDGISYVFREGQMLAARASLVLAKDPAGFGAAFTGFTDSVLDFSGALSNGGETIALADARGMEVWAISYDDHDPWPSTADGLGDSLQLLPMALDMSVISNWRAQTPTPGQWFESITDPTRVPIPSSLALLSLGLLALNIRRKNPQFVSLRKKQRLGD
ncbi:lamin tail domain-containing protein [Congregibacter litoralis]|uniref:PEP-CTERM protein sorting domain protein n=1 Tax=Congregibacter litoralis KT71 TaxID=314285 RepID=A4AD22_9GAMM|nr:lamin tail domain-containing protein [Congregibacter litoralis]EAQ96075.1 PEP-CTERM protein sorting domain protein [Congregibacter litoralis KT71]